MNNLIPVDFRNRRSLATVAREEAASIFDQRCELRGRMLRASQEQRDVAFQIEILTLFDDERACKELERLAVQQTRLATTLDGIQDELFQLARKAGA